MTGQFSGSPPAERPLRCGMVVLARSDPRVLHATLQSVRRLRDPPDVVKVVVAKTREHLFSDVDALGRPEIITAKAQDGSLPSVGFNAVAPHVDIAILAPEGVVFATDFLSAIRDQAERWQDVVGQIELVNRVIKLDPGDNPAEIMAIDREWSSTSRLRGWLRARSLLASIFWARVAACPGISFAPVPEFCDFLAFALFLDRLRLRGRTALDCTDRAQFIRLLPERRTGFDIGYALYSKLGQLAQPDAPNDLAPHAAPSYLRPRAEKLRLFAEQALQVLISPRSKRHVLTFINGMLAARRDLRAVRRTIHRDVLELG